MTIDDIMKMDGRKRAPDVCPLARRSHVPAPSVACVRNFIHHLEIERGSGHSGIRSLLPYALMYCEERGYDFTLTCIKGRYWLEVEGYVKPELLLLDGYKPELEPSKQDIPEE